MKRRICFCTKPLTPLDFLLLSLKLFQLMALLGLLGFLTELAQFKPKSQFESLCLSLKIILNLMINFLTFYSIIKLEQKKYKIVRRYGMFIVAVKFSRVFIFVIVCFANIVSDFFKIKNAENKADVMKNISNIISDFLLLGLGTIFFGWMVYLGYGIIKMSLFLEHFGGKIFSKIEHDLEMKNNLGNRQIITMEE